MANVSVFTGEGSPLVGTTHARYMSTSSLGEHNSISESVIALSGGMPDNARTVDLQTLAGSYSRKRHHLG